VTVFVLVGGWPASGKSTLAQALAAELGLAYLSKDEVKESLVDALGASATVEVRCRVDKAVARERFRNCRRDARHLDDLRAGQELWGSDVPPLGAGLLVEVDTTGPVDVDALAQEIGRLLRGRGETPASSDDATSHRGHANGRDPADPRDLRHGLGRSRLLPRHSGRGAACPSRTRECTSADNARRPGQHRRAQAAAAPALSVRTSRSAVEAPVLANREPAIDELALTTAVDPGSRAFAAAVTCGPA
jgi:hypothetical protein